MEYQLQKGKDLGVTRCGDSLFRWGTRTYVMGIINLSVDSFSGDGFKSTDEALEEACRMEKNGADIIDVGGESTRPDSRPITAEEEIHRIIPFVKQAVSLIKIPLSVDTYKVEVARQALQAGANIVNDVSGLKAEPDLIYAAAEKQAIILLTSNQRGRSVSDIIKAIIDDLRGQIDTALKAGIDWNNIIIDPGIGFGKSVQQNLEIINKLPELAVLKRPLLLGTSRKSFIGHVLDLPVNERFEGTAATVAIGISKGADIIRVHDVQQMKLISRMSDAICRTDYAT